MFALMELEHETMLYKMYFILYYAHITECRLFFS